jgi:hypothetical protein
VPRVCLCAGGCLWGERACCLVELAGLLAVVGVGPRVHQQVRHADRRHPPAAPRLCRTDEPVEPPVRRHHVKLRLRGGLRERSGKGRGEASLEAVRCGHSRALSDPVSGLVRQLTYRAVNQEA